MNDCPDLPCSITCSDEITKAGKATVPCQILLLDNNNFHCYERDFIIRGKAMTPKEQRIEHMKNRIAESKRALGGSRQVGPLVVIFFGIVLFFIPVWVLVVDLLVWESLRFCWRLSGHIPNQEMQLN